MAVQATLLWTDVAGSGVINVIKTGSGIGSIETAMQAHSNALLASCSEGSLTLYSGSAVNAFYPLITTTAILIFADTLGSHGNLYLPSPDISIFMSDNETVDPSAIPDIIAAAVGNLLSGAGSPVSVFVKGFLLKGKVTGYASTS